MRLSILLIAITSNSGVNAQLEGAGIFSALGNLIAGLNHLNVDSTTIGIDNGLVSNAVLGIGRTVERNPFPIGDHDQFLVKDRMRLGLELGAGLVISGTVTYAKEWTLVYPVPTSKKGTLSRKFLLDLFLPRTIKKIEESDLPQDYSIIRETYLEGKGRLKVGEIEPLFIGGEASIGKVKLNKIISRKEKNGKLSLIKETSRFWRLANKLWVNFFFLNIPLFDFYEHNGSLERDYLDVKFTELEGALRSLILEEVFRGGKTEVFNESKLKRKVSTQFKEQYAGLTLFGLFNKETFNREDFIVDRTFYQDGDQVESYLSKWWQWENRHQHDWTTGIKSEEYQSRFFISGKPILENNKMIDVLNPSLKLNLIVIDDETSLKEVREVYSPLVKNFAYPSAVSIDPLFFQSEDAGKESRWNLEVHYDSKMLDKLIKMKSSDLYSNLAALTGKTSSYWQNTGEEGLHSRDRRRLRQSRPALTDVSLAKQTSSFLRFLQKAKKSRDKVLKLRYLLWAFRKTFTVGMGAWDIRLFKAVNRTLGPGLWFGLESKIFSAKTDSTAQEIKVTRIARGESLWTDRQQYNFILEDPSEIYHFFGRP